MINYRETARFGAAIFKSGENRFAVNFSPKSDRRIEGNASTIFPSFRFVATMLPIYVRGNACDASTLHCYFEHAPITV